MIIRRNYPFPTINGLLIGGLGTPLMLFRKTGLRTASLYVVKLRWVARAGNIPA